MRAGREDIGWHVIFSNDTVTVEARVQCMSSDTMNKCDLMTKTQGDILKSVSFSTEKESSLL